MAADPQDPIMPHNSLESHELDRLYPPIVVPAGGRVGDYVDDGTDGVLQSGLRVAESIRKAMTSKGRTRWRDDQSVGRIGEYGLGRPTHTEDRVYRRVRVLQANPHREQVYW